MKPQSPESQHFDERLNANSYLVILIIFMVFTVLTLNIIQIEKHKKTEARTSVTHNVKL